MVTIARLTGLGKDDKLMNHMIDEIRKNRCRKIEPKDMNDILKEINEEMVSGRIMFKHLMEDTIWSATGERPMDQGKKLSQKGNDWSDLK